MHRSQTLIRLATTDHLSLQVTARFPTPPREAATSDARGSLGARTVDPRGALPPGSQKSAARAASRGSSGHAWSAGFDWAAVVVVTGKRPHSGLTVPGAARSPLVPTPPCSPKAGGTVRSPHGVRPGKVPAATGADPWAAGPGEVDHTGPSRPGSPGPGAPQLARLPGAGRGARVERWALLPGDPGAPG